MPFFSQIRLLPKDAVCQKKKTKKNGAACVQPRSKGIIFHFDAPVLPARVDASAVLQPLPHSA